MSIQFISPLPVVTCRERLRASTDQRSLDPFDLLRSQKKPVIATFREAAIILEKRRAYRNSFASLLVLRLHAADGRTRIDATFRMPLPIYLFLIVWFGGVLAACGLILWKWSLGLPLSSDSFEQTSLGALIAPFMLLLGGLSIVGVGKGLAASEKVFLLDFVRQTLDVS